jgi:hypothetical protein
MSSHQNTTNNAKNSQDTMRSGLSSASASAQRFTDQVS